MPLHNFDHARMLEFSISAIQEFAINHQEEVFYGFSIDASMLCMNSEEEFARSLASYQSEYPGDYSDAEEIQDLRINTGDWAYQGFVDLRDSGGFDDKAYDEHYASSDEVQKSTPYGLVMDKLVTDLITRDAFACLTRTPDFFVNRVEHGY
ncbi:hypothetical protein [Chamaesiphon sp.]|uniref:hypothetical protein n=1 Tax=Chamaesiphon sp. TaxID=2814140 RepID=UPI003592EAD6